MTSPLIAVQSAKLKDRNFKVGVPILDDRSLWLLSTILDYAFLGWMIFFIHFIQSHYEYSSYQTHFVATVLQGFISTFSMILREKIHFCLLGSRVSKYKRNSNANTNTNSNSNSSRNRNRNSNTNSNNIEKNSSTKSRKKTDPHDLINLLKVTIVSMISLFLLSRNGLLWLDYNYNNSNNDNENSYNHHDNFEIISFASWKKTFLPFYAMLLLRDFCCLAPFHKLMHSNLSNNSSNSNNNNNYLNNYLNKFTKLLKQLHNKHHEAGKDCQSLHAYHITVIDLIIENAGAPGLLLILQHLLGIRLGMSWETLCLFFTHDYGLHSINPYCVMYFNPLLDYIFYPNVTHNLHHIFKKEYLLFVPYSHILPSNRKLDGKKYNLALQTEF